MAKPKKNRGGGRPPSPDPAAVLDELDRQAGAIAGADAAAAGPLWGAAHKLLLRTELSAGEAMRIVGSRDLGALRSAITRLRGDGPPEASAASGHHASGDHATGDQAAKRSGDAAADRTAGPTSGPTSRPTGADEPAPTRHEPEELRRAMRAFRKRLKLVRLDRESGLGVGPMTGGKQADVDAIMPPREFPVTVWTALVEAGELRPAGRGFYRLASEAG